MGGAFYFSMPLLFFGFISLRLAIGLRFFILALPIYFILLFV
jgi:hypothetical protein